MTQADLFDKYADYIPDGWYGFDGICDEWCPEIDALLEKMVQVQGFEIHQIKEKFGGLRFYVQCDDEKLMKEASDLENKLFAETPWAKRIVIMARQTGKTEMQTDLFKALLGKE